MRRKLVVERLELALGGQEARGVPRLQPGQTAGGLFRRSDRAARHADVAVELTIVRALLPGDALDGRSDDVPDTEPEERRKEDPRRSADRSDDAGDDRRACCDRVPRSVA